MKGKVRVATGTVWTLLILVLLPLPAAAMEAMEGSAMAGHTEDSMPWFGRVPAGVMGGTTHHRGRWMAM